MKQNFFIYSSFNISSIKAHTCFINCVKTWKIPPSRYVQEASRSMAVPTSFCSMNNTVEVDETVDGVSSGHELLGFECMVVPFSLRNFCLREA